MKYTMEECVVSRDLQKIKTDMRWAEATPKDPLAHKPWFKTKHHGRIPSDITDDLVNRYTKQGDWVADTFAGSGTMGCSALALGRNFLYNEMDPGFVEDAKASTEGAREEGGHDVKLVMYNDDARLVDLSKHRASVQLVYISPPSYHPFGSSWHTKDGKNLNWIQGKKFFEQLYECFQNTASLVKPGGFMAISGRDFCVAKGEKMPSEWIDEKEPRLVRYSCMLVNMMLANGMEPVVRYLVKSKAPWNKINHKKYGTPLIPYDTFAVCQMPK